MNGIWLLTALAVPALLTLLTVARDHPARTSGLIGGALAAGVVLGPIVTPFAVVAPFAPRLGPELGTLASAWLESGFLEELAKAAALWLLLVPHRLATTPQARATGAVLISLGFGAYENLLYLADASDPAGLVLMRSLISVPAHLAAGLAAAVMLMARPRADATTGVLAFLAAWFSHGAFNQWALAWSAALGGDAMPENAPLTAVILLAGAPVASTLAVIECWRRMLPQVRGGSRVALSWAAVTLVLTAVAIAFLQGIWITWQGRPAMLIMALPFAALPLALAWMTGSVSSDAWRCRRDLAQVRS